jgi:hypothetical protein
MIDFRRLLALFIPILAAALACNMGIGPETPSPTLVADVISPTALPDFTQTPLPQPTVSPTATVTATIAPSPTPFGCAEQAPPEDYTRVEIYNGIVLSRRTISMLEYAQTLYGGSHNFLGALTQGSYNMGVDASFGTHDAGGAIDISMRDLNDWNHILYDEQESIILALRRAGFAAYVRDVGALYPNSPVHIHAIAIGDAELSEAAQLQLTGPEGYFRGYNALPENPLPDVHGGPILCPWMIEMGYSDLR